MARPIRHAQLSCPIEKKHTADHGFEFISRGRACCRVCAQEWDLFWTEEAGETQ